MTGVQTCALPISIINSTIANNTTVSGNVVDDYGSGVALMGQTSQVTLLNSLLYNNTAGGNSARESISLLGGKVMATHSAIETTRNFDKDDEHFFNGIRFSIDNSPAFVSVNLEQKGASVSIEQIENMNFRLSSTSVAVNAGNNIYIDIEARDLAANNRLFDGIVDLGAYEFFNSVSNSEMNVMPLSSFYISNGYLYADGVNDGELIAIYSPLGVLIKQINYNRQPIYLGTNLKGVWIIAYKEMTRKVIQ